MTIINKWTVTILISVCIYGGWLQHRKWEAEREVQIKAEVERRLALERQEAERERERREEEDEELSRVRRQAEADRLLREHEARIRAQQAGEEARVAGEQAKTQSRYDTISPRRRAGQAYASSRDEAPTPAPAAEPSSSGILKDRHGSY